MIETGELPEIKGVLGAKERWLWLSENGVHEGSFKGYKYSIYQQYQLQCSGVLQELTSLAVREQKGFIVSLPVYFLQ